MAAYRIHIVLEEHEGQKTGRVRSCTRGTRIEAPEGEFADLAPGRDYSRLDDSEPAEGAPKDESSTQDSSADSTTDTTE
jgi:hypothetical protein